MFEKLESYAEDLSLFEDDMDRYEYIIDIGKKTTGLSSEEKSETHKIKGCQSSVWIIPREEDGKLFFQTDSDTVIVKGLAYILADIFSGHSAKEISQFKQKELEKLGLEEIISKVRLNGFNSMLNTIYSFAKQKESA